MNHTDCTKSMVYTMRTAKEKHPMDKLTTQTTLPIQYMKVHVSFQVFAVRQHKAIARVRQMGKREWQAGQRSFKSKQWVRHRVGKTGTKCAEKREMCIGVETLWTAIGVIWQLGEATSFLKKSAVRLSYLQLYLNINFANSVCLKNCVLIWSHHSFKYGITNHKHGA